MHGYFIESTSPDEKIDFLTNYQGNLELVLGTERIGNLIHGLDNDERRRAGNLDSLYNKL